MLVALSERFWGEVRGARPVVVFKLLSEKRFSPKEKPTRCGEGRWPVVRGEEPIPRSEHMKGAGECDEDDTRVLVGTFLLKERMVGAMFFASSTDRPPAAAQRDQADSRVQSSDIRSRGVDVSCTLKYDVRPVAIPSLLVVRYPRPPNGAS